MAKGKTTIRVALYIPGKGYREAGYILLDNESSIYGFAYRNDYDGPPLDPIHLDYRRNGRAFRLNPPSGVLHGVFEDHLPGSWGRILLNREYPESKRLNDAELLHFMGSRRVGAFRFRAINAFGKEEPVRGFKSLDHVREQSIRFLMRELREVLLTDTYRWSLTLNSGARPKVEFESAEGQRGIAKFNTPHDPYNMARVEYGFGELGAATGMYTADAKFYTLPSGQDALVSYRFNQNARGEPIHRLSMATLLNTTAVGGDYREMVAVLRQISANPEADIHELYRRMLFNIGANNTDDHLKNFECMLTEEGWRLAPAFDVSPDVAKAAHVTALCGLPRASLVDDPFIQMSAAEFGIPGDEALAMRDQVLTALVQADDYLLSIGVPENEVLAIAEGMDLERMQIAARNRGLKADKRVERQTPDTPPQPFG